MRRRGIRWPPRPIRRLTASRSDRGNRRSSSPTASANIASAAVSTEGGRSSTTLVKMIDQLVVQPPVDLRCAVHRDDPQQPVIVVPEDADINELLLHGPAGAAGQMPSQ